MEYGDVFISDDGTRAVRWISNANVQDLMFMCEECTFEVGNCGIYDSEGWTKLVEAAKVSKHIKTNLICGEGLFKEVSLLEAELLEVGES